MHFSLEEWSDFARQRATDESAAAMQSHLDRGCAECAGVVAMWRSVLDVAGRESQFEAPESGVRYARALFSVAGPQKQESLPVRFARLVFSSFAEPLREGVRGAEANTCHLLFEEGNWLLDLHMKPHPERYRISVAGQILERLQTKPAYDGHSVSILHEKVELARAETNEFGEFQLEFTPGDELLLSVKLSGESVLVSALPGFTARSVSVPSERRQ